MKDIIRTIDVLKFWHFIEFFTPFNLNEITDKPGGKHRKFLEDEIFKHKNNCLPWLSETALALMGGNPQKRYKYQLYLLPFDKSRLTKISQHVFPLDQSDEKDNIKQFEFEERFDDEGETCFARIAVDGEGHPAFDRISISTLPWALGKLQGADLKAFSDTVYREEEKNLKNDIQLLNTHLDNADSQYITDSVKPGTLTAAGLIALLKIFKKWANFLPENDVVLVIELQDDLTKEKPTEGPTENNTANKQIEDQSVSQQLVVGNPQKEVFHTVDQIDILNSFYIDDLEKAINHFAVSEKDNAIISDYIQGINHHQKIDVYQKENYGQIINALQPDYLKQGRWPLLAKQYMSLMQQFAINTCFHQENKPVLFSVNGPPGTGKTTLLQDIIAENIVGRARILATFHAARDAFKGECTVTFASNMSQKIKLLDDRLTGFEMLVVSSNNAAVENISKELPLQSKIPEAYQGFCAYLAPVAAKNSAEHISNQVKSLKKEEKPWGLISVALGNSANRYQFRNRVFNAPEGKGNAQERIDVGEYLTIWEWYQLQKSKKDLFAEAKKNFIAADKALQEYVEKIKVTYRLGKLELEAKNLLILLDQSDTAFEKMLTDKSQLALTLEQHRQFKPSIWQRIIWHKNAKSYQKKLREFTTEWHDLLSKESGLKNELRDIQIKYEKILSEIADLKLCERIDDIILPPPDENLENSDVQLRAFWQNETVNHLRLHLFTTALKLHEAWLAEAMRSGFSGNLFAISWLLDNKHPVDKKNEEYIWQSLFMWVPVISSTFASVGRQFRHLGEKTLGWVFIDEAGQAIPQAAVGALWRARHSLVVGDPLQIEPVFTIPPSLIEGWAKHIFQKADYAKWLPTLASVQTLADDANSIGTFSEIDYQLQWIGSPLRVHRRCLDPMFSISNQIAYQDKMINARHDAGIIWQDALPQKSCWFHIEGEVSDKQYVPAQGEWLLKLLAAYCEHTPHLPDLYIITPFKQIKRNLQKLIGSSDYFKLNFPNTKKWCSTHIGTVHTFQGKEAPTVIVVLGTDDQHQGAANWAASKPNLLNVTLTRARDRIYFIGDHKLWSSRRYFSEAARLLPVMNLAESHKSVGMTES